MPDEENVDPMTSSATSDVVVLGSGLAGLAGALAAHQLGLRPIVLEKAKTLGGGTVNSYGLIWVGQNHLAEAAGYGAIVLTVDLRVQAGDPEQLKERVRQLDQQRRGAQPPGRNCGSVFQNPAERSAWQYIDDVGLREHRIGNAQFSKQHSNFIQNLGGATAADVRALITLAQERVRERFSVELIPEVMRGVLDEHRQDARLPAPESFAARGPTPTRAPRTSPLAGHQSAPAVTRPGSGEQHGLAQDLVDGGWGLHRDHVPGVGDDDLACAGDARGEHVGHLPEAGNV